MALTLTKATQTEDPNHSFIRQRSGPFAYDGGGVRIAVAVYESETQSGAGADSYQYSNDGGLTWTLYEGITGTSNAITALWFEPITGYLYAGFNGTNAIHRCIDPDDPVGQWGVVGTLGSSRNQTHSFAADFQGIWCSGNLLGTTYYSGDLGTTWAAKGYAAIGDEGLLLQLGDNHLLAWFQDNLTDSKTLQLIDTLGETKTAINPSVVDGVDFDAAANAALAISGNTIMWTTGEDIGGVLPVWVSTSGASTTSASWTKHTFPTIAASEAVEHLLYDDDVDTWFVVTQYRILSSVDVGATWVEEFDINDTMVGIGYTRLIGAQIGINADGNRLVVGVQDSSGEEALWYTETYFEPLGDPFDPEDVPGSKYGNLEDPEVWLSDVGAPAARLQRDNYTGVLNALITDLNTKLAKLIDKDQAEPIGGPLDVNRQQCTGVADATQYTDLVNWGQVQEALGI